MSYHGQHICAQDLTDFYDTETAFQAYVRSMKPGGGTYVLVDPEVYGSVLQLISGDTKIITVTPAQAREVHLIV